MAEKKGVATDSLKLSIAQIISLAVSMLNVMLLSRFRTVEEYGTYSQMIMVSAIIYTFFSSGFSQCINYFIASEKSDAKRATFIKTYYAILTISGLIGGILSVALLPSITRYFNNEALWKYSYFMLVYPIARILNDGVDRFFIIYKKTNQLMFFKIRYGLSSLVVAVLAVLLKWNFDQYLIVFTLVELIFAILVYYFIFRVTHVVPLGFNTTMCKNILAFAIPMALAGLISIINKELDKFIIGGVTNTETLALYTNAAKELPVTVFTTSIATVVMPHVVKNIQNDKNKEAINIWNASIKLTSLIMCFFCVAFFTYAPQVISVLYSDKYLPSVNIFRIYLLTELFRLTYYGMVLNAQKKTKLILYSSIGSMLTNLALDILLFKMMGITGPAWATVISVAAMNLFQLMYTKHILKVSFFEIYPVKYILKCLLLNCVLGIFFYYIQQYVFNKIDFNQNMMTVFLGCIWGAVYLFIIRKKALSIWRQLNS